MGSLMGRLGARLGLGFGISVVLIGAGWAEAERAHAGETVIVVHGFLTDSSEMDDVALKLRTAGYKVIAVDYDTRSASIEVLADEAIGGALEEVSDVEVVHFVTHSMGGLLMRSYLERNEVPNLERAVMLAPPNHGSEVAAQLSEYQLYREFTGPAGVELGALELEPRKVGDYELGIIAGTASVNPIFSPILPGPDDGYVAVESTPLEGMDDYVLVGTSHGLITSNESALEQVVNFLETGAFDHEMEMTGYPVSTQDFIEFSETVDQFLNPE